MKKWFVTWIDNNGAFRNGIFYAKIKNVEKEE